MSQFQSECYLKDTLSFRFYNKDCSGKILEELDNVSQLDIETCINNSFVNLGDYSSQNTILLADQNEQYAKHVKASPQITIGSGFFFRGEFDAYDIKRAVCAAFKRQPVECKSTNKFGASFGYLTDPSSIERDDKLRKNAEERRLLKRDLILGIAIVIVLNIIAICVYRWVHKRKHQ